MSLGLLVIIDAPEKLSLQLPKRSKSLPTELQAPVERLGKAIELAAGLLDEKEDRDARRRALIVAIDYTGQCWPPTANTSPTDTSPTSPQETMQLYTHKDAMRIKALIMEHGYNEKDIRMLLDDDNLGPKYQPTRANIIAALEWLVEEAMLGDRFFFYFAGHGDQVEDLDGDESDGQDETILPVDYRKNGMIVDDEIFELIVEKLPFNSFLTAVVDSCHSGTILDLPVPLLGRLPPSVRSASPLEPLDIDDKFGLESICEIEVMPMNNAVFIRPHRNTLGDAVSFSACTDKQLAYGWNRGGWFTHCFIKAVRANPNQTYRELYERIMMHLNHCAEQENKRYRVPEGVTPVKQTAQIWSAHLIDIDSIFRL